MRVGASGRDGEKKKQKRKTKEMEEKYSEVKQKETYLLRIRQ